MTDSDLEQRVRKLESIKGDIEIGLGLGVVFFVFIVFINWVGWA